MWGGEGLIRAGFEHPFPKKSEMYILNYSLNYFPNSLTFKLVSFIILKLCKIIIVDSDCIFSHLILNKMGKLCYRTKRDLFLM